ncbi:hypothetical protein Trydic_g23487 [Trypoxylus dichotomus]
MLREMNIVAAKMERIFSFRPRFEGDDFTRFPGSSRLGGGLRKRDRSVRREERDSNEELELERSGNVESLSFEMQPVVQEHKAGF